MKQIDYSKAKYRIFMIASLVVYSWLNITAWNDEIDSFNQLDLHMSKWWVFAFCSFMNVLQNIAVWIFGIIFNDYWTILIMHALYIFYYI